jgi:VTC domain
MRPPRRRPFAPSQFPSVSFRFDRLELKFVITPEQRERLMPEILPHVSADENATETAYYPIVSLYYDNADRDCYWQKVRGWPSRRKMRVRVYGSLDGALPPTTFLEVKHKHLGRVVKRRARIPLEMALAVGAGEKLDGIFLPENDRRVVEEANRLVHENAFRPSCCMRYDRYAYSDNNPDSDLRITFDTGIAYRFENFTPIPDDRAFDKFLLPEGFSVMEVKVIGCMPYWLSFLIGKYRCIFQSHSKYCNALEDGDPVLHRQLGGRVKIQYGVTPPLREIEKVLVKHDFQSPGLAEAS